MDTLREPREIGVWVSGAEIQTSAVDIRTAVWVSTAEKCVNIVLGETRNFSRKFRGVSAPALYKNPAVNSCPKQLVARHFLSVAPPAEPRGEKKTFFCANFGW